MVVALSVSRLLDRVAGCGRPRDLKGHKTSR